MFPNRNPTKTTGCKTQSASDEFRSAVALGGVLGGEGGAHLVGEGYGYQALFEVGAGDVGGGGEEEVAVGPAGVLDGEVDLGVGGEAVAFDLEDVGAACHGAVGVEPRRVRLIAGGNELGAFDAEYGGQFGADLLNPVVDRDPSA
ncbi:hypothetical protein [Kribbella sp. HUAS MG21]|uniref:Uncharacterized protein n=1 Tax=Kribbella sp. HUAS MG21 TaxID=3160966 RepID=A0AAU7TPC2_9ACTN